MIDALELRNFRAFRREKFDFSKLNIFVGPNNSGKSSALSALNVLAQTNSAGAIDTGPLVLNGDFDQLGTFKDAVHGGRANTPMGFTVNTGSVHFDFEVKYRLQRRELYIQKFRTFRDGRPVFDYISTSDRYDISIMGKSIEQLNLSQWKRRPRFRGFFPEYRFPFRFRDDDALSRNQQDIIREFERDMSRIRSSLMRLFHGFETISPFRIQPQRTYLTSGETPSAIGQNGQNTVTLLASDASKRGSEKFGYVDQVSKWLRVTGIASSLRVKHLTDRHFEITVVGLDGTEHNICDVGFGVSQVLPVLTAGIRHALPSSQQASHLRGSPILVVQEPEIHLHPNAQAELGTFFASVARMPGQIFLETHSDSLVLRIARHVALGDLSPDDVRIFYVSPTEGGREVTRMLVDESGAFEPDWPNDFFPQRQIESLELARVSMANSVGAPVKQMDLFDFSRSK